MTTPTRTTPAQAERRDLVAALRAADPSAPTLCEGWTVHDLAAHLVARERRPDFSATMLLPGLVLWSEVVRKRYKRRSVEQLAAMLESGPPRWTLAGLPGVDARMNLAEHFVHCEDVRRGAGAAEPRVLEPWREEALWGVARSVGKFLYRSAGVGVTLRSSGGVTHVLRDKLPMATVEGAPGEIVLHMFNRRERAQVEVLGDTEAVRALI